MKQLKLYFIFFILVSGITVTNAQDKKDIEILGNLFEPQKQKQEFKEFAKSNKNEIQWFVSGLFLFYKSMISSQDANRCVFHPSCSVYAIQSIKKNGFLIGFADALDRLSRCNRLSPENYTPYENTLFFYDPVW